MDILVRPELFSYQTPPKQWRMHVWGYDYIVPLLGWMLSKYNKPNPLNSTNSSSIMLRESLDNNLVKYCRFVLIGRYYILCM